MTQIYNQHLWGGNNFDFYSGEGSHLPEIIMPYLESVSSFLKSFKIPLTVCDLGCGDFNIGKNLVKYTKTYVAIDIVEALIKRNKQIFNTENLEFYCLDISKETLPEVDCVILRQVLQHLTNDEISNICKQLKNYKYIILTEHLPIGNFCPNINIISGQGIRIKHNSGVDILQHPFNFKAKKQTILNNYFLKENKGKITTFLLET